MKNIREIAHGFWTEQDIKDVLANIMDLAKQGSLRHADFVFKVMTYEPKIIGQQLSLDFKDEKTNEVKLIIVHGTENNSN